MKWRFTLIDRNNVATVVEEPMGWDTIEIDVKRDKNTHGIFFDYQTNDLQFSGKAREIIINENAIHGVEGKTILVIEESCNDIFEELYRGNLQYDEYEETCGDECFVTISIATTSDVLELNNKYDQKINLQTLKAFDEVTNLVPYAKLPFTLSLPSKGVFIQDKFVNDIDNGTPVLGPPLSENGSPRNTQFAMLELGFNKQVAMEIGNSGTELQPIYNCVLNSSSDPAACASINRFSPQPSIIFGANTALIAPLDISSIVNFQEGTANYEDLSNPCNLQINILGTIKNISCENMSVRFFLMVLPKGANGALDSSFVYYDTTLVFPNQNVSPNQIININASYSNSNFILNKGDQIYSFYHIYVSRLNTANVGGVNAFEVKYLPDSFFKLTNLSKTPPTDTKAFMVNEAFSRIAETITNDKIKAYSEYFGRTDSEPYNHATDGCGSLEVITKGLMIRRQEDRIPNKPFTLNISLKDMFEGLNPIHNIGFGIEDDTNRLGFKRLRIEPWKYFYKNNIILNCLGVSKLKRKTNKSEHYSIFSFGYQKWEAEQYTGLDEFLTKRKYRTTLTTIKNELSKLSAFIASGYALEITRRKGNEDSKDWRYDADTFIICVTKEIKIQVEFIASNNTIKVHLNGNTYPTIPTTFIITGTQFNNGTFTRNYSLDASQVDGSSFILTFGVNEPVVDENSYTAQIPNFNFTPRISVELGNVTTPQNIVDPDTLYNFRISPIRNAMRWLPEILAGYKTLNANSKIIFTDGDANYFASGKMKSTVCRLENQSLAENQSISKVDFANPAAAMPLLKPERFSFDYTMSVKDFKNIIANPYGVIYFENECETGEAWIESIKYKPNDGKAQFTLIPKYL